MVKLESTPFLKVLLPYIAGIVLVMQAGLFHGYHMAFAVSCGLLLCSFLGLRLAKNPFKKPLKTAYFLCLQVFFILLAFETVSAYRHTNDPGHYTHRLKNTNGKLPVTGIVYDVPVQTEKFLKLPLQLEAFYNGHAWQPTRGTVIVYAPKDTPVSLHRRIAVNAGFSIIQPPANPYEFDYAAYLADRNIFHVLFAKAGDISVLPEDHTLSLSTLGTYLKSQAIETLRSSGLSKDAFSICSALLVGYDDEIDNSVMNSFSHSGTLHVLSVSGLHTGILYACIIALFGLFDKYDRYKKLKCMVVLACMVMLMAITGFAPAVCRAVVMLSLVLIGRTFFSRGNSFNTLFVSAFILLLFNPYLIKDLGFLLSYFAVFGIMYLHPKLSAIYTPSNRLVKWMLDSTLLSISATVFTLPLSLYYFHQFPTWFILSNLLIIPISIGIMLAALLLLVLHKVLILKTGIAYVINLLTTLMIGASQLTDSPRLGYVDLIPFTAMDLAWMTLSFLFLFALISRKRFSYACCLGITLIGWLLSASYNVLSDSRQNEAVVFKTKHGSSVLIKQGQSLYYAGDSLSPREFDRTIKPYLQHRHYAQLTILPRINFIQLGRHRICLPDRHVPARIAGLLKADTWLVSSQSLADPGHFKFSATRQIIATAGNRKSYLAKLQQACAKSGVHFHSVYTDGAFVMEMD